MERTTQLDILTAMHCGPLRLLLPFLLFNSFKNKKKRSKPGVFSCQHAHVLLLAEACLCISVFSFSKQRLHGAASSRSNLRVSGSWTLGKLQAAASQQEKEAPVSLFRSWLPCTCVELWRETGKQRKISALLLHVSTFLQTVFLGLFHPLDFIHAADWCKLVCVCVWYFNVTFL